MDKLKDTGNRTNLSGTGAERDINPENGRCDLLPASLMATLISDYVEIPMQQNGKDIRLVEAMRLIFRYVDTSDSQNLVNALFHLMRYNYDPLVVDNYADNSQIFCKAMIDLSLHYKRGAEKYAERNWEKGLPIHSFIDSGIRHLCKEIMGMTDEPHLIACMWNVCCALWTLEKHPELNDMPKYEKENVANVEEKDEAKTANKKGWEADYKKQFGEDPLFTRSREVKPSTEKKNS